MGDDTDGRATETPATLRLCPKLQRGGELLGLRAARVATVRGATETSVRGADGCRRRGGGEKP